MYEKILIPTDGSQDASKGETHGVDLAAATGATVHALYVIEEGGNPWMTRSMEDQNEEARAYGQEILDKVAAKCADANVECVTDIEVGPNVAETINEYAQEHDIDVIVMGSGYRGAIGGLLGSTAERVLRSTTLPVTTLRRGETD